jgi:hypothetical protein
MRIRNLVNPGSGIRDGKNRIRDKHPGFSTLLETGFSCFNWPLIAQVFTERLYVTSYTV